MLFIIHAVDRADALDVRLAHYEAHKQFVSNIADFDMHVVMSGPLVSDDGHTAIGSFYLVEAQGRDAVMRFNQADPFYQAGIWENISISAFARRQG